MNFGQAIEALKQSKKVARKGWNVKNMCLMYVKSAEVGYRGIGIIKTLPWIGIKTVQGGFVPWLASQADMLAEDWVIVE
jgi:hypothetical protein